MAHGNLQADRAGDEGMTSDSLNLLAYQAGLVATPLQEQAASAARDLCTEQALMRIGDPLPLVFCRRVGDVGGVLVSPPATEARFANSATNVLTASWHLVVSEGPIDPIEVRDVFQCACRVGTSTQSFSRRAGNWSPGNVTVDRGGTYKRWDVPRFCGAAGTFNNLHTLSFVNTFQDGEEWNRQVHAFIRGGRHVTRLVDGVTGPSNNVVDLYLLLLRKVERIPENLIDLDNLRHAARFTEALGMRFDGNFSGDATQNLDDWRENVLKPYFLLQATRINGREGLMPLLPTNLDGSIYTGVVRPHATLTELDLDLSTWDLQFLSLADRRPICAQMMWRQQADGIDSIVRTTEVRFRPPYDAPDGPFEQHDLSEFACSERHIAKVGAYLVAHRALVTHTLKVDAIPGDYNSEVSDGMIVRVTVPRAVDGQIASTHDYLYRVVSIEKDLGGTTVFNLVHFPLDAEGRSALSMPVISANPTGLVLPIAKTGPACDVNSSTDTTDLPDDGIPWDLPTDNPFDIPIDPPFDPIDPIDPPIPPNPPMQPMPPGQPDRPMPPDPPGPDGPTGGAPGVSGGVPGGSANEEQKNPDKQALEKQQLQTKMALEEQTTTSPPAPTSPTKPWGPLGAPQPGMQAYDIRWDQVVDSYSSTAFDCSGKKTRDAEVNSAEFPDSSTSTHYAENVTSWVFVQSGTTKYTCAPTFTPGPQGKLPLGISAFNSTDTDENGFGGLRNKGAGGYQGFGSASGPTFETRSIVFFARVRNFRIRKHGTQEWQAGNPGPGQDGDTL
jgi:hypothetical protein